MSRTPPRPSPRTASRPTAAPPPRSRLMIAVIVALAVVVLGVIAVVSTRGGDDDGSDGGSDTGAVTDVSSGPAASSPTSTSGDSATDEAVEPAETRPVTVVGDQLTPLPRQGADPDVGQPAPVVQGLGFDGAPVELASRDGEPLLVVVLAHWCPHCNAELPRLVDWYESGRVPEDLRVVGVSTAADDDAPNFPPSEWVDEKGWPWEMMADSDEQTAAAALGVSGYPFMVVIGGDGSVLGRHRGELGGVDQIDAFVRDALGT